MQNKMVTCAMRGIGKFHDHTCLLGEWLFLAVTTQDGAERNGAMGR
jgi:hypothetical protein